MASSGLLTTGVAFHQIDLLSERGLTATAAAANFLPQTAAGIAATLLVGFLIDRYSPRFMIVSAMAGLAAGLAWATVVTPGWSAIGFGLVIGAAANAARAIEAASTPRLFGTAHLGSIRAVVSALNIGSTAFGPLAFATVRDVTGSYAFALLGGILLPVAVAIAALLTPLPSAVAARRRSESG